MDTPLISPQWLNDNFNKKDLVILDASPTANKSGLQPPFPDAQIKGARHFDLKNDFSDPDSAFPNTLPSPEYFAKAAQKLGINQESTIIVYDNLGIYTSPRVWWMFKTMGHDKVAVLDGGLPAWINEGYSTTTTEKSAFKNGNFKSNFNQNRVKDYNYMVSNIADQEAEVLDARAAGRFNGTDPEPRKGLKSGHIQNSKSLPFKEVLSEGKYKSKEELKTIFSNLNATDKPLVFSCGSGLTACIILLASELVLPNDTAIYDGSWTEWATKQGLTTTIE